MIFCVAELLENRRRAKNSRCCQGVRHRSQRCFSRLWKSFKTTGMCSRRHRGGRVRSTTPAEDRWRDILVSAKGTGSPQLSGWQIQFLAASGKQISQKTVAKRLRGGGGLYARRPVVCAIDQTAAYCPFAMVS
ncbi:hypothetical protein TNCV_4299351 [Trichonephila clavipes]|nr:hypothetical protein TNCV_4299351 [Trichonephila clavipes]